MYVSMCVSRHNNNINTFIWVGIRSQTKQCCSRMSSGNAILLRTLFKKQIRPQCSYTTAVCRLLKFAI
jgi:hypothetical protein